MKKEKRQRFATWGGVALGTTIVLLTTIGPILIDRAQNSGDNRNESTKRGR